MKSGRLHNLDAMRGILMLVGVYFHLAFKYSAGKDNGHIFFDWFTGQTHYFRMPAFFILAGFFGALLYYRRGAKSMMLNRFKRILLPLVIFLPIIHVIEKFGRSFSKFQEDNLGIVYSLKNTFTKSYSLWEMVPWESTHHLWFLNFLFVMSLFVLISDKIFVKSKINDKIKDLFSLLFRKPNLGIFFLCLFFGLLMSLMNKRMPQGDAPWWSWTWFLSSSGIKSFVAFCFFYFVGWQIYHHKHLLLNLKIRRYFFIGFLYNILLYWALGFLFNKENNSQYDWWDYAFIYGGEAWDWIPFERKKHEKKSITFTVDMSNETVVKGEGEYPAVYVAINQDYGPSGLEMKNIGDGLWSVTVKLNKGTYNYYFRNGLHYEWNFDVGWEGTKGLIEEGCNYSEYNVRRIFVKEKDLNLGVFCWSQCSDCEGNEVLSAFYEEPMESKIIKRAFIFLWNFGIPLSIVFWLTVFIQLFNNPSNILRYISDSSYWIYIVHTIFLSFVPSLFYHIEMNVFLKFIINALIVTLLCFLSYHFLVRKTFIGKLLNGKKYD